jgi:hypothetical protein
MLLARQAFPRAWHNQRAAAAAVPAFASRAIRAAIMTSAAAATDGAARMEAPSPPEGQTHWPHRLTGAALEDCWVRQLEGSLAGAISFCPNGNNEPPR